MGVSWEVDHLTTSPLATTDTAITGLRDRVAPTLELHLPRLTNQVVNPDNLGSLGNMDSNRATTATPRLHQDSTVVDSNSRATANRNMEGRRSNNILAATALRPASADRVGRITAVALREATDSKQAMAAQHRAITADPAIMTTTSTTSTVVDTLEATKAATVGNNTLLLRNKAATANLVVVTVVLVAAMAVHLLLSGVELGKVYMRLSTAVTRDMCSMGEKIVLPWLSIVKE